MITGCFQAALIRSAAARATISVAPPAGNGTMMRTARSGKEDAAVCAATPGAARLAAQSSATMAAQRGVHNVRELAAMNCDLRALGDRGLAASHGLADLEAFGLRMVEVERLVLAGIPVRSAERLRLGPGFERHPVLPDRVRGIEREVVVLGTLEQVELDEARDLVQVRIAAEPHLLEILFGSPLHAEAVHGDEHRSSPGATCGAAVPARATFFAPIVTSPEIGTRQP